MITWPIYTVITFYILSSPLLNAVIMSGGIYAPVYVLAGAVPVLLLAYLMTRKGINSYAGVIFCASLFVCVISATGLTVNKYLYQSKYAYVLTVFLLIASAVGLIVRESAVRYSSKILGVVSGALFVFIITMSMRKADFQDLWPVNDVVFSDSLISIGRAFFALTPILLPLISGKTSRKLRFPIVSCLAVIIVTSLYLLVFPYFILTEEKNLILEISKNISFGRFFQRMEFVSVMIFLILSILILIYIITVIGLLISQKVRTKIKNTTIWISVFIFISAVSLIAVSDRQISVIAAWVTAISAVISVLLRCFTRVKNVVLPIVCCLIISINLSSCMEYSEIDTFAYPLIVGVEESGDNLKFYFRTEDATYSANGMSIVDAQNAVNRQSAKQLDLSQLGMVLTEYDSFDTLTRMVEDIQESYIHNTVQIAVTGSSISELEKAEFSSYSSISEFLDEYKSVQEQFDIVDSVAFRAYVKNKRDKALLLPSVVFSSGEMLVSGAIAYGKGERVPLSNPELKDVTKIAVSFSNEYSLLENGEILQIRIKSTTETASLIEKLYNKTGFDVCGVCAEIACKEWSAENYKNCVENIRQIEVVTGE